MESWGQDGCSPAGCESAASRQQLLVDLHPLYIHHVLDIENAHSAIARMIHQVSAECGAMTKGSASAINGPLLTFEVTQSGFGLYIKYLLAGFLMIFALSMLVQFMSYMLSNMATLLHEPGHKQDLEEHAAV